MKSPAGDYKAAARGRRRRTGAGDDDRLSPDGL